MEGNKENYTELLCNLPSNMYHEKGKTHNLHLIVIAQLYLYIQLKVYKIIGRLFLFQLNAGYLNNKKYTQAFISKVTVNIPMTADFLRKKDINIQAWMPITTIII